MQPRGREHRQPDLRVGRAGQGTEAVGAEHLDLMALGLQQLHDRLDGAHHAVDLRAPGVGDDGDAQPPLLRLHLGGRISRQHRLLARMLCGPADDTQAAVEILDQGGAALYPVTGVDVPAARQRISAW